MNRLTLNQRLWSIVFLLWFCLVVVVLIIGIMTRARMLDEHRAMLKQEVDMALGAISFVHKEAADGKLSADDAKRRAIETLRGMRWGKNGQGFFGIYDSSANAILMPLDPESESKNMSGLTAPNGLHVATEIVRNSSPGGSGYTQYPWPRAGTPDPVDRLTYGSVLPDWDWHVYTSVYTDDINTAFRAVVLNNLAQVSVIGLLLTAAMLWLIRNIRTSLGGEPAYAAELCRRIAAGDLTGSIELRHGDTSSLLYSMAQMQTRLTSIVTGIKLAADSITVGANEIATGNADLSQRTEEQASALAESASSMDTLTANVKLNANNAELARQFADEASGTVSDGERVVSEVVGTILSIADSSKEIEQIIGVIDGIAFQTNILALNAAVEAARAGEQGRGFAVVASEVRSLAQRSASAARQIKELIDASVANVTRGQSLAGHAGESMQAILKSVQRVTDIMGEISAASAEQSNGIGHVGIAITQMDTVTQQNAALVEQAAASAAALAEQAGQLKQSVAIFRLQAA